MDRRHHQQRLRHGYGGEDGACLFPHHPQRPADIDRGRFPRPVVSEAGQPCRRLCNKRARPDHRIDHSVRADRPRRRIDHRLARPGDRQFLCEQTVPMAIRTFFGSGADGVLCFGISDSSGRAASHTGIVVWSIIQYDVYASIFETRIFILRFEALEVLWNSLPTSV
jgi:hypothetical protein